MELRYNTEVGGNPFTATFEDLSKLRIEGVWNAAQNRIEFREERFIMANALLGTKAVGSIVKLNINGAPKDFIVVHQGLPSSMYDESCNGTWILMNDCYEKLQWHSSNVNDYANSTIHSYLNSTVLNLFDSDIQAQIKTVKIPYHTGNKDKGTVESGSRGLSTKIFLLSGCEVGSNTGSGSEYYPLDGAKLDYFDSGNRFAYLNGSSIGWCLRSPNLNGTGSSWRVETNTISNYGGDCTVTNGVRPALILPPSLLVSDDGSVTTNTAPTAPPSITIPDTIQGGSTIDISWGAATDAKNNLESYIVERSVDGATSWVQIYQGSEQTTRNTVPVGTQTVMYRVMGCDSEGLYSNYRTSAAKAAISILYREVFSNVYD